MEKFVGIVNMSINSIEEFKNLCRVKYDEFKANIKKFKPFTVDLDYSFSDNQDNISELNNYLMRFAEYTGQGDLDGKNHKEFLKKIKINIYMPSEWQDWLKKFGHYDKLDLYVNTPKGTDVNTKRGIDICECVFRFSIDLKYQSDFSLVTKFEHKYRNVFRNSRSRCVFLVSNLDCLDGWEKCKYDAKEDNLSDLTKLLLNKIKDKRDNNKRICFNIKANGENIFRISTYVSALVKDDFQIIINNILVRPELIEDFGALPPAVFVTQENLSVLQTPLEPEVWEAVKENKFDVDGVKGDKLKRYDEYKPLLKICHRYLFDEFKDNESNIYTELRKFAYESDEFERYVTSIPFLALLIFSIYDGSYRSDLLADAKSKQYYKTTKLEKTDFLLDEQQKQNFERFIAYRDNKSETDVKNLLYIVEDKPKLHPIVVSEIFECVSIAEGLLQILENAALHAGGGLLSMRLYSRAKKYRSKGKEYRELDHIDYLDSEYSKEYFELNSLKETSYYLEVQISDLPQNPMSIPKKFVKNYTCDEYINGAEGEEKEKRKKIKKLINDADAQNKIDLNYFFEPDKDPSKDQVKLKGEFFGKDNKNFVFHYGLEIFKTIVTARKGIFAVCGYRESYTNFNSFFGQDIKGEQDNINKAINNITENREINGSTYRILLPLNHNAVYLSGAVNSELDISPNVKNENSKAEIIEIKVDEITKGLPRDSGSNSIEAKRTRISSISVFIENKFSNATDEQIEVLCLNFKSDSVVKYFEEIIKGCVLFVLNILNKLEQEKKIILLPVALVNLTPFQMIEATRIMSIFYSNNQIAKKSNFDKFQFYLKSTDGKDLILAGKDLNSVRERLIKTAMINGAMNSELTVIEQLMRRMVNDENR